MIMLGRGGGGGGGRKLAFLNAGKHKTNIYNG